MARILVSHFSGFYLNHEWVTGCFYDGFISELKRHGNEVYQIISSDFIVSPWNGKNTLIKSINKQKLNAAIKAFDPELVIAFNNSTIEGIETLLDCPIVLWNSDSVSYFNNKESIKKNKDRYHYFAFSTHAIEEYEEAFGADPKRIERVVPATAIQAENKPKTYGISFIGNYFHFPFKDLFRREPKKFAELIRAYEGEGVFHLESTCERLGLLASEIPIEFLRGMRAGQKRNQVISEVADLGLVLFGPSQWGDIGDYSIDVLLAYDHRLAYSLIHNQDIYNRSKIGISISHSQNVDGSPWRVLDIMASTGCLIADFKQDLVDNYGKYVQVPAYRTHREARKLCQHFLQNDQDRLAIVKQSNEAIDAEFRWHHRFAQIESIFPHLKLLNLEKEGSLYKPSSREFCKMMYGGHAQLLLWALNKMSPSVANMAFKINRAIGLSRFFSETTRQEVLQKYLKTDQTTELTGLYEVND